MNTIKEYKIDSLGELKDVAEDIVELIKAHGYNIVRFNGEMGAGKTTLIRMMCEDMGIDDLVTSPTFAIINEYKISDSRDKMCYHFDFYRIRKIEEVLDMGYEEYFYSGNLCLIEWPELVEDLLPSDNEPGIFNLYIDIVVKRNGDRIITLKNNSNE